MLTEDYFSLFGLTPCHTQDLGLIEGTWKALAARVHPDRYATASASEQRVALQWAARINDAYRVLRDPLLRARYLCERAGVDVQLETNTAMRPEFLMRQMAWRERLDDMHDDTAGLAELADELRAEEAQIAEEMGRLLDNDADPAYDPKTAALKVREWMFLTKLADDVANACRTA